MYILALSLATENYKTKEKGGSANFKLKSVSYASIASCAIKQLNSGNFD